VKLLWHATAWPVGVFWWVYFGLVRATSRVECDGLEPASAAIYVNWHHHQAYLVPHHGARARWMMVSPAPRLAPIAVFCRLVGLKLARGASGERGRDALVALRAALAAGESIAIAVDGPAGPAYEAKRGCAELARDARAPIVPIAFDATRAIRIPRWDRLVVPLPFGRIRVKHGAPIAPREDIEATLLEVKRGLDALLSRELRPTGTAP
jgi:lysophospholipid acyltransferase (LPLAT)-like uncharacterized protein